MGPVDKTELGIRFGCGFIFGLLLFGFSTVWFIVEQISSYLVFVVLAAIVLGLAAMKFGDAFLAMDQQMALVAPVGLIPCESISRPTGTGRVQPLNVSGADGIGESRRSRTPNLDLLHGTTAIPSEAVSRRVGPGQLASILRSRLRIPLSALMQVLRIALFAILLFILNVAVGALIVKFRGPPMSGIDFATQYSIGIVVSACVFAYMSWTSSTRPYASALLAGILSAVLGVLGTAIVAGDMSRWNPVTLIFDLPALLVAVLLGVSLGLKYQQRRAARQ